MRKLYKRKEEESPDRLSDSNKEEGNGEKSNEGGEGSESHTIEDDQEKAIEEKNADPEYEKAIEDINCFLETILILRKGEDKCPDLPELPETSIQKFISTVEKEISKCESDSHDDWKSSLLDSIERLSSLSTSLSNFSSNPDYRKAENSSSKALQHAMSFLEEEFRLLLENCRIQPPEESKNEDPYPPETVNKLRRIAEMMISAGYESECCQTFSIARRNVFDSRLSDIGFGKIGLEDVQKMAWATMEGEIVKWIMAFRESISSLFSLERGLCESVFSGRQEIAGSLFSNLARGIVIQLLNFVDAIAMINKSAEKLFKVLDMYETLRDMLPEMDGLFPGETDLKSEISSAWSRVGEAAVAIFRELGNSVKADAAKVPVPGGAVHPLTRYVMNYLEYACEYTSSLEEVFVENHKHKELSSPSSSSEEEVPPFTAELIGVMDLLDLNLESKSKQYKESALRCIFLMNNGRYIAKKIKDSPKIYGVLGNNWYRKRSSVLREYHKSYQRETWSKVLGCLKDEGLHVKGSVSRHALKERLRSFNAMVEEIHKTQRIWVVSDEQLQSELRVSISAVVVPAYRSFLGRYEQYFLNSKQPEKYIKFSSDDLETYIDELFVGNASNHGRKKT